MRSHCLVAEPEDQRAHRFPCVFYFFHRDERRIAVSATESVRNASVTGTYMPNNTAPNSFGSRPSCVCKKGFSGEFCNTPLVSLALNDSTVVWLPVPYQIDGDWYRSANFYFSVENERCARRQRFVGGFFFSTAESGGFVAGNWHRFGLSTIRISANR